MNFDQPPKPRAGNVTAKQVKAFIAAVEHKNFSEAARKTFQSQSAFSRCIQDLESALGKEVFTRSSQGIKLSDFGSAFMPYARRLMTTYVEAQSGMERWLTSRNGKLTLAGSSSVMHVVLPTLMRRLREEFEQPSLLIEDCASAEVVQKVLAGKVAMGLCTPTSDEPDLRRMPLLEAPIGLLVAPCHALPPVINDLNDLKHLPFLRYSDDSVISSILRDHDIAFDAYFNSPVESCGVPGAFPLVREENMVMLATGFGATHPQAADLRFVPLVDLLPSVQISLISRRGDAFDGPQQIMMDLAQDSIFSTTWHSSVQRCMAKETC